MGNIERENLNRPEEFQRPDRKSVEMELPGFGMVSAPASFRIDQSVTILGNYRIPPSRAVVFASGEDFRPRKC
jgi:hypothetical protein